MNKKFIIVEAGSTLCKSFLYENDKISELPFEFIEFKKNYTIDNRLLSKDKEKLFNYINNLKNITGDIHIYGTSIFRVISNSERLEFINETKINTGIDFNIVSSDEEEKYTVNGVISNIEHSGNIAVLVSGGGSVELAIISNNKIIEKLNLDIGGVDITNLYPDLANDIAKSDINEVVNYIEQKLKGLENKADVLVTAGGATKYFREKAKYKFITNVPFSYNIDEFVIIDNSIYDQDKMYFYNTSLEEMKKNMPETPNWWNPTRAIICFVEAVAKTINAKYIAASNINMIYGIIEEIKNKKD